MTRLSTVRRWLGFVVVAGLLFLAAATALIAQAPGGSTTSLVDVDIATYERSAPSLTLTPTGVPAVTYTFNGMGGSAAVEAAAGLSAISDLHWQAGLMGKPDSLSLTRTNVSVAALDLTFVGAQLVSASLNASPYTVTWTSGNGVSGTAQYTLKSEAELMAHVLSAADPYPGHGTVTLVPTGTTYTLTYRYLLYP